MSEWLPTLQQSKFLQTSGNTTTTGGTWRDNHMPSLNRVYFFIESHLSPSGYLRHIYTYPRVHIFIQLHSYESIFYGIWRRSRYTGCRAPTNCVAPVVWFGARTAVLLTPFMQSPRKNKQIKNYFRYKVENVFIINFCLFFLGMFKSHFHLVFFLRYYTLNVFGLCALTCGGVCDRQLYKEIVQRF